MTYRLKKRLSIAIGILITGAIAVVSLWWYISSGVRVLDFNLTRDQKQIVQMFDKYWYWLIPGDRSTFSPELMLTYQAPHQNPMYAGRMAIKVMRDGDALIGFVGYYMKSPQEGFLNFVAVNEEYRGKGYAQKMAQVAVDDMIKRGAKKIKLVTRPSNLAARAVYKRLGFRETGMDDTFVYIENDV